jgi:hypothetical protein
MTSMVVASTFPGVMSDEYAIDSSYVSHGDCFQPHPTLVEFDELISGVTKGDKKINEKSITVPSRLELGACVMNSKLIVGTVLPKRLYPTIGSQDAKVVIRPVTERSTDAYLKAELLNICSQEVTSD